jgi:glycosyltransferase involved in cell wall biosynthesis
MTTLGIFTVKLLYHKRGAYWTHGGFGEYVKSMLDYFDSVVLFAHVRDHEPKPGFYSLPLERLEVVALPYVQGELQALLAIPAMWKIGRRHIERVDIVHARMPDYTGIVGSLVATRAGVPYFCQIVADWAVQAKATPYLKRAGLGALLKLHLRLYDVLERRACRGRLVFAQGDTAYAKHRKRADAHLVVSSAHRRTDIVTSRQRFVSEPYSLLCVARLDGVKNQVMILRALRILLTGDRRWRATFVGDGPRFNELKRQAGQLGVSEHVTFAGMVARGACLWSYYDAADVFVLSSRSEGTPKVVLEAMARAVPVVATRVGGVPTIVKHGENGLLVQDDDVDDMVAALRQIAASPELRTRLIEGGLETATRSTVEAETEHMMRVVRSRWPDLRLRTMPGQL